MWDKCHDITYIMVQRGKKHWVFSSNRMTILNKEKAAAIHFPFDLRGRAIAVCSLFRIVVVFFADIAKQRLVSSEFILSFLPDISRDTIRRIQNNLCVFNHIRGGGFLTSEPIFHMIH